MLSDPLADSLRGVLRQIYAGPFVQCVIRNPLVDWENGEAGEERSGVDNDAVSWAVLETICVTGERSRSSGVSAATRRGFHQRLVPPTPWMVNCLHDARKGRAEERARDGQGGPRYGDQSEDTSSRGSEFPTARLSPSGLRVTTWRNDRLALSTQPLQTNLDTRRRAYDGTLLQNPLCAAPLRVVSDTASRLWQLLPAQCHGTTWRKTFGVHTVSCGPTLMLTNADVFLSVPRCCRPVHESAEYIRLVAAEGEGVDVGSGVWDLGIWVVLHHRVYGHCREL
jgi:hypothetical protein